jgi:hypothetical protein
MPVVRRLAALLLGFSVQCMAAPFAVQVGEVRIGLDAPPGFSDTSFTASPRLQEFGESLTSASNRILLFAISDADLRRFTVGDQLDLRRYMLVVTSKAMDRERVSESSFRVLVNDSLRELGQPPAGTDYVKVLDSRPPGEISLLAELRKDAEVASILQGARTKGAGFFAKSKYLLSTTTLLLVRGKALTVSVFTQYEDAADAEWIRVTTLRWIDELKRLNSR